MCFERVIKQICCKLVIHAKIIKQRYVTNLSYVLLIPTNIPSSCLKIIYIHNHFHCQIVVQQDPRIEKSGVTIATSDSLQSI